MKILLLNTPAKEKHLRSNYCSNVSKGSYYYPAIDLLVQSGVLSAGFDIDVCDAIIDNRPEDYVLRLIKDRGYHGVYALTGSSSRSSDLAFFRKLKEVSPATRLLVTGGYLLTGSMDLLKANSWIDGVLLDWSSGESISFFRGEERPFRFIDTPGRRHMEENIPSDKKLSYPLPRHGLFPLKSYHHPNARYHPYSVIVHSSGCPYRCDYCIYSITELKVRQSEDVIEEISYLKSRGVRELFFQDPTFAADRKAAEDLLDRIIKKDLKPSWFCQTRVDHMDEELLTLMAKAGCHAVMFGVETVREDVLKDHGRRALNKKTEEVYRLCRKLKIDTLSYLIIGLPEDTEESIIQTLDFVKKIGSDYVSFNIAVPVIGTQMRDKALKSGLLDNTLLEFDNSCDRPFMPTKSLTIERLADIHAKAVKEFYLRPSYMVKRLASIRSCYELRNQLREGFSMIKRLLIWS